MDRKRKLDLGDGGGDQPSPSTAVPAADGGSVSRHTGRPFSQRYHDILETRKGERRGREEG
jgi:ketosteroid isomerase-like protein